MFNKIALTAAAVAALPAGTALAGGLDPVVVETPAAPPVVVAPARVTGDWGGFYAGGQLTFGDVETDGAASVEGDGSAFGVHAGYLADLGSFVLGAELDYDAAEYELDGGAGTIDGVARLKAIAGYDAGRFLPYATIGVAQAYSDIAGVGDDLDDSGTFAGVGVRYQVSESFDVSGEVLAHQFDDYADSGIDVDVTTMSLRASYRF